MGTPSDYSGAETRFAQNAFYSKVFRQLRAIASRLLLKERAGHTLQPTALVSEAFLKLRRLPVGILDQEHFFRIAADAMQQVLIESARAKFACKRIPPSLVFELIREGPANQPNRELRLAAKLVFERLRAIDPNAAESVWLRSVEGLTLQEVSRFQGRPVWRVRADHDFGLRWMSDQLTRHAGASNSASSSDHSLTSLGRRDGSGA